MRSSELSSRAGVTIRTLRHYHQIGVLDEPSRSANGYRQYGVHDLIRVLRIRRLAALGVPLEKIPSLLEDTGTDASTMLEQLDLELATQIEHLSSQRDLIAQLRCQSAPPDAPLELAPLLAALSDRISPEVERIDQEQTVLVAHLSGDRGMSSMIKLYKRLGHPEMLPALIESASAFYQLGEHTGQDEIDALVARFTTDFGTIVDAHRDIATDLDRQGATQLVEEYVASTLNDTQRGALEAVIAELAARTTSSFTSSTD